MGWAWSPAQQSSVLWPREPWGAGWLIDVLCSQHPGPQWGWGWNSTLKGSPVRCHLLETGAEGDTFVFFFFFELKLSVISTQSQGRGPVRKISLSAFLPASLWLWLPGDLHDSFPPVLSLFPKTPELSPVSRWGFDRVSSCVKRGKGLGKDCRLESLRKMPPREVAGELPGHIIGQGVAHCSHLWLTTSGIDH